MRCCLEVDFFGQPGIGLAGGALGQRRAMDDQGRLIRAKPFFDRRKIRQVKQGAGEGNDIESGGGGCFCLGQAMAN
jgi:hypothetical protein